MVMPDSCSSSLNTIQQYLLCTVCISNIAQKCLYKNQEVSHTCTHTHTLVCVMLHRLLGMSGVKEAAAW